MPRPPMALGRRERHGRRPVIALVGALVCTTAAFLGFTVAVASPGEAPAGGAEAPGGTQAGLSVAGLRSPMPAPTPVPSADRAADFTARFGDSAAMVVIDASGTWRVGGREDPRAWSTIKPLLAAAVLSDAAADGPSADESEWLTAALSWSDNDAAVMLFSDLADRHGGFEAGAARANDLLRRAGDATTQVIADPEAMGDTQWPLAEQAHFWSALSASCVLDSSATNALLDSLGQVVAEQAWGLGRIGASAYKGGWELDEDGSWLLRQVGLVPVGGGSAVVAMALRAPAGDLAEVTPQLDAMAAWVREQLAGPAPQRACA